jgi:hypothetical protein
VVVLAIVSVVAVILVVVTAAVLVVGVFGNGPFASCSESIHDIIIHLRISTSFMIVIKQASQRLVIPGYQQDSSNVAVVSIV